MGGLPSADVLDRLAKGLMLTDPERDHLHILAFGHPPEQRYRQVEAVSQRLQHVLDAMPLSPASFAPRDLGRAGLEPLRRRWPDRLFEAAARTAATSCG